VTAAPKNPLFSALAEAGRRLAARGWASGTSGNFSAVVSRDPLCLAITASGLDKTALTEADVVEVDGNARHISGAGKPSAETHLHAVVARVRGAGAVMHTHSVWSTLLSDAHALEGGLAIEGYEMLKGLDGVATHEHREWIPIVENAQDMPELAHRVEALLRERPDAHAFLLRRHGLYTWGRDLAEAVRHVEILEFLFEVLGRREGRA
jgi:methylthioribulose-1-phosphate dehydratase